MLKAILISSAACLILSGCVGWKKAPSDLKSVAQVRFVALQSVRMNNIDVDIFNDPKDACKPRHELKNTWVAVLEGIALDNGRKDLGMPLGEAFKKSAKTEIQVEGNRRLIYSIGFEYIYPLFTPTGKPPSIAGLFFNTGVCKVSKSFVPQSGANYEVTFKYDEKVCESNVYEIKKTEGNKYIRYPLDAEENSAVCDGK
jgi:hypothetical protein